MVIRDNMCNDYVRDRELTHESDYDIFTIVCAVIIHRNMYYAYGSSKSWTPGFPDPA